MSRKYQSRNSQCKRAAGEVLGTHQQFVYLEKAMTNKKFKTLAAVIACTMALGAAPSVPGTSSLPAVTTTVEAAAKNVTLKVSSKKVKVGKKVKLNAKATKGAKLSYKSSNKKIAWIG